MEEKNILEMRQILKIFPGVKALDNVDFNLRYCDVDCLIGANCAVHSRVM